MSPSPNRFESDGMSMMSEDDAHILFEDTPTLTPGTTPTTRRHSGTSDSKGNPSPYSSPALPRRRTLSGSRTEPALPPLRRPSSEPTAPKEKETAVPVVAAAAESTTAPRMAYNGETEISMSRIFDLGRRSNDTSSSDLSATSSLDAAHSHIVAMSSMGQLGRFGNQVLQYMYLRCYAEQRGLDYEVSDWVGKYLFGNTDNPLSTSYRAVIENKDALSNTTFNESLLEYIAQSNNGNEATQVFPDQLNDKDDTTLAGTDIWGWFQLHTQYYAPHREFIQRVFQPVPALETAMQSAMKTLRSKGKTVVAVHVRRGDYTTISMTSFGYIVPTSWYLEWLDRIWPTLEDPVLYVATDDRTGEVVKDFARYNPETCASISAAMPESLRDLKAGFYPDHYVLCHADKVAISNSTFSFTACMLNQVPGAEFVRPHWADRFVSFDPWNAMPILHRPMRGSFLGAYDTLKVIKGTQGWNGVMRNIFLEIPGQIFRSSLMAGILTVRTVFGRLANAAKMPKPPANVVPSAPAALAT